MRSCASETWRAVQLPLVSKFEQGRALCTTACSGLELISALFTITHSSFGVALGGALRGLDFSVYCKPTSCRLVALRDVLG